MPALSNTFLYSGTLQQVVIPAGTTSIDVYLWGGGGGGGSSDAGGPGGVGAAAVLVAPAQNVVVQVERGECRAPPLCARMGTRRVV